MSNERKTTVEYWSAPSVEPENGDDFARWSFGLAIVAVVTAAPGSLLLLCVGTHLLATPLGIAAIVCGIASVRRARRARVMTNPLAWTGIGIGLLPPLVFGYLLLVW
jgi:hypothetical protein